jgi:putative transposase
MYTTKKIKATPTPELDTLACQARRVYSKVVSLIRKVHKRKGFWLSKNSVQKYLRLCGYQLHSHTVQACVDSYFDALKSYWQTKKVNPDAKPPFRTRRFYKVRWKSTAISFKDGIVRLSNGKGRAHLTLKSDAKPVYVEMYFQRGSYYFSLVFKTKTPEKIQTGTTVAVDMGEVHPIVAHDGENTTIYNGRFLRSIV